MLAPTAVFLRYLEQLRRLLQRIDASDSGIGCRRLHPDMFPLLQQARIAIGFTLRTCCPLAGRAIVSFADEEHSFPSVLAELERTAAYLAAMPADAFRGMDSIGVDHAAGFADLHMTGGDYFLLYGLPNFFFHYSMVYAIARQAGLAIGKTDFDGFHYYPQGFTFTDECDPADLDVPA